MADLSSRGTRRSLAAINALAGFWLALSPWIYGAYDEPNAWNSWLVGAIIFLVAVLRYSVPGAGRTLSIVNMLMGVWVFLSPWIFRYTGNRGRFLDSLIVGVLVFCVAASGLGLKERGTRAGLRS